MKSLLSAKCRSLQNCPPSLPKEKCVSSCEQMKTLLLLVQSLWHRTTVNRKSDIAAYAPKNKFHRIHRHSYLSCKAINRGRDQYICGFYLPLRLHLFDGRTSRQSNASAPACGTRVCSRRINIKFSNPQITKHHAVQNRIRFWQAAIWNLFELKIYELHFRKITSSGFAILLLHRQASNPVDARAQEDETEDRLILR